VKKSFTIEKKDAAIFIMPRSSQAWVGAEALWITVAGWAASAKRKFGHAWVMTSDRSAEPEEVIHYPLVKGTQVSAPKGGYVWIPSFVKIFLKDVVLWRQSKRWKIDRYQSWSKHNVAFVWQQHDLFQGPGRRLANELGVPLVTYVHAPVVWETAKWNVKRYLWGWFLERFVEAPALKRSDVVACVSEEVAQKLVHMGVQREKVLVSPMAVDQYLFEHANHHLRETLGLTSKTVIGWTGSFRTFHGLDLLVRAFHRVHSQHPSVVLLLVGDGAERSMLEELVAELKIKDAVLFAGRQPFARIPDYVSVFDIAVVSARSAEGFHYSPLKLREYLAAGKPVLAPRAGEIPQMFTDNVHLKLYTAGDVNDLANAMEAFIKDPALGKQLSTQGKAYALQTSTWDYELNKLTTTYFS
jgi:glycosyltransferase involved in cell wall biosynthesis